MNHAPILAAYRRQRDLYLATAGGSLRTVAVQASRDTDAAGDTRPVEPATALNCTREHRMQEIACYVFLPDGTWWAMYEPCVHGISEAETLCYPTTGQTKAAPDQGATREGLSK